LSRDRPRAGSGAFSSQEIELTTRGTAARADPRAERPATGRSAIAFRDDPSARLRLFCLPYAGGGASTYQAWSLVLPRTIQVSPLQLPGRENRFKEQPFTSLAALVETLAETVAPFLNKPFALLGHSLGGTIAFELARELRRRHGAMPVRLIVSGCRAPHRQVTGIRLSSLPQQTLLDTVQQEYGPIPDAILRLPELLDLLVPVLRADLTMIETYRYVEEAPLDCPISAFAGADDATIAHHELTGWRDHTTASFDLRILPGGHFFIKESRDALLHAIDDALSSAATSPTAACQQP
jgi:surfactin synthase thioesterase subunit